jgi:hypothetical protein
MKKNNEKKSFPKIFTIKYNKKGKKVNSKKRKK